MENNNPSNTWPATPNGEWPRNASSSPPPNGPEDLANEVEQFVKKARKTTFVDIQNQFARWSRGEITLGVRGNLVLWAGLSEMMADAMIRLLCADRVRLLRTSGKVCLVNGGALTLPEAGSRPNGGFARPHWLPVFVCAPDLEKRRRSR